MGVGREGQTPLNFANFSKEGSLSFKWEKQISPFLPPPRKTFGKIY